MERITARKARGLALAPEFAGIAKFSAAVAAILTAGVAMAWLLPDSASLWMVASAFLAPASLAFAVYWWTAQGE